MSVEQIEWKDPGPSRRAGRGGGKNLRLLEQLQERPGQWAVVARGKSSGQGTWWKRKGCETATRRQPDDTVETFARWPEGDTAAAPAPPAPAAPGPASVPATSAPPAPPAPRTPLAPRVPRKAPAAPVAPAPPADVPVQLPPPRSPDLVGHKMGDCTCGRRDVLLDRDDLCILCRTRRADAPTAGGES